MSALHAPVLAHQGGWDEMLFVLVPLLIFAALLAMARRRVIEIEDAARDAADDEPATAAGDDIERDIHD